MSEPDVTKVIFRYDFSGDHRIHHVDGMYGGNTVQNKLSISFYADRPPSPEYGTIHVSDGFPVSPETTKTDGNPVREIGCTVIMDLPVALAFQSWLSEKINQMSAAMGMSEEDMAKVMNEIKNVR